MVTRRRFVWSSAAALVASRVPRVCADEAQRPGPVPPSIAALTSMKSQACPITGDERRARVEKARRP